MRKRMLFAVAVLVLFPVSAFALDGEFYTYGGFDAVVSGFQRIALIFSDGGYRALLYSVVVLGLLLGVINVLVRAGTGARVSPFGWLVPIFIGCLVYLGMVVPTGTMHVYSTKTNRYMAVPGVPVGVIMVSHVLNSIEQGLVEIIETSSDPKSYTYQAGGTGYMGLLKLVGRSVIPDDTYLMDNINTYIDTCVAFEVDSPYSQLTVQELRRESADFRVSFGKAANPAIPTTVYTASSPKGMQANCADAWNRYILPVLNNIATFEKAINSVCSEIGFDVSVASSKQQCRVAIEGVLDDLGLTGVNLTDFARQKFIAARLHQIFLTGDTASLTNYKLITNAGGTLVATNEWLPILKGVLTAIALGLTPFIALFLPTPLLGRALSLFLGMMIWLVSWGVIDAFLHSYAIDYAGRALADLASIGNTANAFAMDAFFFAPGELVKVLGMFAIIRSSGLMLATVMTGMLVKFGGHALASMAGNLMGQIQGAGLQAARVTMDPSGRAAAIKSNVEAIPTQDMANTHKWGWGYEGMQHAAKLKMMQETAAATAHEQKVRALQDMGRIGAGDPYGGAGMQALDGKYRSDTFTDMQGNPIHYNVGAGGAGTETSQTTLANGWTRKSSVRTQSGEVVGQTTTFVGAAGTITETTGPDGQVTTHINAQGLSATFGKAYQEAAIEKGAHSLATDRGWSRHWQEVNRDAITSDEARSYREAVSDRIADSVQQKVEDGSAFKQVKAETREKMVAAGVKIGLGKTGEALLSALTLGTVRITPSGEGMYRLAGKDGKTAEFTASESEIKALSQEIASIREDAITQTLRTSSGRDYAVSSAARDNAAEGWSHVREAMTRDTTSTGVTMDLMKAYVDDRARSDYGEVSNETRMRVLDDMNRQRTGSGEGQDSLAGDINAWVRRRYDDYLDTPKTGNHVMRDIASIRNRVGAGIEGHRQEGSSVVDRANAAVGDNSFSDPRQGLDGPDLEKAKQRREVRRGVIDQIYQDNGGFDFGSNPLKQLGRDVASPFVPQPQEPDARNMPGMDPQGPGEQTPERWQPLRGGSVFDANRPPRSTFRMTEKEQKRLEEMLKKLDW